MEAGAGPLKAQPLIADVALQRHKAWPREELEGLEHMRQQEGVAQHHQPARALEGNEDVAWGGVAKCQVPCGGKGRVQRALLGLVAGGASSVAGGPTAVGRSCTSLVLASTNKTRWRTRHCHQQVEDQREHAAQGEGTVHCRLGR